MFTDALIQKIKHLYPTWEPNTERIAQLGRLCSRYTDADLMPIVDEMADDPELRYFDARSLHRRIEERNASLQIEQQEQLTPRQVHADVHRRKWVAWARAHPPKPGEQDRPNYATLGDDGILAIVEQNYRREARRVYGYVPGHWDWYKNEHVQRDPPPAEAPKPLPVDKEFKAPWERLKERIEA